MAASAGGPVLVTGKLPKISAEYLRCIWIYLVRGPEVLAEVKPAEDGSFSFPIAREMIAAKAAGGLELLVGPGGARDHLARVPNLARLALDRAQLDKAERILKVPAEKLQIGEEVLRLWLLWCRWYCVSGVVVGPDGCPVPGADVTVYTVGFNFWGFTKTPRATVVADQSGRFTACFCWCTCPYCFPCWPCWPLWWHCWPWWWELDMLHVIETLERASADPQRAFAGLQTGIALVRPEGRQLVRGQGFAAMRAQSAEFRPDPARTALIRRKLSDARLRAIFPWWWWCCDDPNIVFSATQGGNVIVDENPATDTRWCLPNGSSVTLVANAEAVTACGGDPKPETGFAWTRVGNITVDKIHGGYADGSAGTDSSDLAFAGSLDIYGEFAVGAASYYQVNAGQWAGDPSRGGTAPGSSAPIAADLYNYVFIYHGATLTFAGPVKMGPFSQGGLSNLYATQEARQAGPTPPGLAAFPPFAPGDLVIWAYNGLKVSANASALIAGGTVGAADLTVTGYDAGFNPVALVPDAPLTLTIDNSGLTTAHINSLSAFRADNSPAPLNSAGDCPAYDLGPGGYVQIDITVSDANGHLWAYELYAERGHGISDGVPPGWRGYSQAPASFPPLPYQRPDTAQKSFGGGTEVLTYYPPEDCCYEFRIRAGKRVTNGYDYPSLADYDFWTTTLRVSA
ncbi:MAG TPA: carboxypeptidase-like regulatory domain-containing protein [Stellaceae bacterium]|nr:carboxypeptidase-like regulatory domain-containing protein [Stellaceae bacterium]